MAQSKAAASGHHTRGSRRVSSVLSSSYFSSRRPSLTRLMGPTHDLLDPTDLLGFSDVLRPVPRSVARILEDSPTRSWLRRARPSLIQVASLMPRVRDAVQFLRSPSLRTVERVMKDQCQRRKERRRVMFANRLTTRVTRRGGGGSSALSRIFGPFYCR